jgi:WD repeat-containing protein 81
VQARRLPIPLLTRVVRSVFSPKEYPASLQRLYATTPDEAIPEFYSDPLVFSSLHPDMADMALPAWAEDAEEFVRQHRCVAT